VSDYPYGFSGQYPVLLLNYLVMYPVISHPYVSLLTLRTSQHLLTIKTHIYKCNTKLEGLVSHMHWKGISPTLGSLLILSRMVMLFCLFTFVCLCLFACLLDACMFVCSFVCLFVFLLAYSLTCLCSCCCFVFFLVSLWPSAFVFLITYFIIF